MNRASVFEWHKRFKEGRESVRDDERCGRSKEVNILELIGPRVRVRVRVIMLRFKGSLGRDSVSKSVHKKKKSGNLSYAPRIFSENKKLFCCLFKDLLSNAIK